MRYELSTFIHTGIKAHLITRPKLRHKDSYTDTRADCQLSESWVPAGYENHTDDEQGAVPTIMCMHGEYTDIR